MDDKIFDQIHDVDLKKTMEKSYIDYAMSVIASRALPDVRDGLKPVQRRILYSMIELNNGPDKPHRKCARIVGDTMGKYHPHGDSSIYGALVNLAQEWSTRYPLVDGHGNFGSVDGDGAAAMRYTEARLSKISMEMTADINKDTVDFTPNFDETEKEPSVLPSRFPNLLVNGTSGIAVGMATNIPPHNLREVIAAVVKIIDDQIEDKEETTIEEILQIIKGPDFPTGAEILGTRGIEEAYRTGRGKIRVRAITNIEPMQNGKNRIIVTELPFMVNKARLIEKIAELVRDKKIDGITDLSDQSSREGMRICIELRRDVNPNVILNQLYKHTQLQDTFGVIMLALVGNQPKVMNLLEMLNYYLKHQEDVVTRRTKYDLNKAQERAHILEGLLIALDNIDEVIKIIRGSQNVQIAKQELIKRFGLSEVQAQAIVDMRLRALTGLEREKIEAEYAELMKKIEGYGIKLIDFASAKPDEKKFLESYFNQEIMPLSSPTIVAKRQPFPFLRNEEIYAVVVLETRNKKEKIGIIPCSNNMLPRMIELPGGKGRYMLLEELILHYIGKVFKGYKVKGKSLIRVVRNADIDADALYDEDLDYREFMADLMKQRKKLSPVRLDMSREMDQAVIEALCRYLEITPDRVFKSEAPLDLSFIFQIQDLLRKNSELFYEKRVPQKSPDFRENESILDQIREEDKLLSYPYESIRPFLKMLTEAAEDESVISIKMTLYRLAKQSKVVEALCEAAENGKEVVVLVELRARFDEENNIRWSRMLEQAGCQIIYGLEGYKVHSKLCLITRRSEKGIEYITQIGTGNYNEKTARLYTDLCLMTVNEQIGMEAARVFQALTKGEIIEEVDHLMVAPKCLQSKVIALIDEEIRHKKQGEDAYIGLKLNSLTDKRIIDKLVEASKAGVRVDMIIRGICCMVPGIKGETENVHIISIVGRFLEHSRIYIFGCGERTKYYIGSADFMTRNTVKRVEVATPVYSEKIKKRIRGLFDLMLSDNKKARTEDYHGKYSMIKCEGQPCNSQEMLYQEAYDRAAIKTENKVVE